MCPLNPNLVRSSTGPKYFISIGLKNMSLTTAFLLLILKKIIILNIVYICNMELFTFAGYPVIMTLFRTTLNASQDNNSPEKIFIPAAYSSCVLNPIT